VIWGYRIDTRGTGLQDSRGIGSKSSRGIKLQGSSDLGL